jgi:hypothetical protein
MADDDQSIDDQAETATGGLTNDMPGLPMSPPGGPRPPSALGGLAQSFQRMMGGAPPPRPVPQGRSPWQAPGQSQVPVQPGQVPPDQRWKGTTASLFLPKGAPQPQAKFTPFMRSQPTTSHDQWGQEELFPQMPKSFEAPSLLTNASKFFGQNGSPAIAMLALSMGKNAGAFLDGVMKGQEWKAKMHREQMQQDAEELALKQQKEMYTYFDTVDEYASAAGVGSASQVGSYAIKGVTLLDALGNEATKLGDDKLLAVLGTGSVDKALAFLHQRNDNWQTLSKTTKAMTEQDKLDREEQSTFGQTFGGTPGGGGQQSTNPANNFQQPGGAAQTPQNPALQGGPAPTVMPADQHQQQSQAPTAPPEDTPWAKDAPNVQQAARLAATGRGVKFEDKRANDYITNQAMKMQDWIYKNIRDNKAIGPDVIDKDGHMISSPVADALNKYLGGQFADDSTSLTYYNSGLGGGQTGGGGGGGPEQNYNQLLKDLANKRRPGDPANNVPGWQQRNYQLITDFEKNNKVNTTVRRMGNLSETGRQLDEAIDGLPSDLTKGGPKSAFAQAMSNIQQGRFTGDSRFIAVANAWNNYNTEKNVLLREGVGGVGETERAAAVIPPVFQRPEDFRLSLVQDAQNVYRRGLDLKQQYRELGGQGDPPGWDRDAFAYTTELANREPIRNAQPGDRVTLGGKPAIWRGYYDKDGHAIPREKRYEQVPE